MPTLFYSPAALASLEDLDRYLAMGWRTTGQSIYNCNFLELDDGNLVSVLPSRLPLAGHQFSKGMRKILRRNSSRYTTKIRVAGLMKGEESRVNSAYMAQNPAKTLLNLSYHTFSAAHQRFVLNTHQVAVYDGKELVAFSYFDVGEKAAYGKAAVYDPRYAKDQLGLFTMIQEVEFCKSQNLHYYYPGYVSDDTPLFDYKHRIGLLEFYELFSQQWIRYGQQPALQKPLDILLEKTQQLEKLLQSAGWPTTVYAYKNFSRRYLLQGHSAWLDTPLFIYLKQVGEQDHLLAYFNPDSCSYDLLVATVAFLSPASSSRWRGEIPYYPSTVRIRHRLFCSAEEEEMLRFLEAFR